MAYTVKSGDTLSAIARSLGISLQQLEQANPQISNFNLIYPGQSINTPGGAASSSSPGGETTDPTVAYSQTGANLPWEQQIVQAELEATQERHNLGYNPFPGAALAGFHFDPGQQARMMQAFTWAQQWMQAIGWKTQYLPSAAQLLSLANNAGVNSYEQAANAFWSNLPGQDQQTLGFARYGMDRTTYENTASSYTDVLGQLTGDPNSDSGFFQPLLNAALSGRWSTSRLREELLKNPDLTKKYQYLKYGYNYETWQNYLNDPTNKSRLHQRFGNSSESSALSDLANPLTEVRSSGGRVEQSQGMQQRQQIGQSEVR